MSEELSYGGSFAVSGPKGCSAMLVRTAPASVRSSGATRLGDAFAAIALASTVMTSRTRPGAHMDKMAAWLIDGVPRAQLDGTVVPTALAAMEEHVAEQRAIVEAARGDGHEVAWLQTTTAESGDDGGAEEQQQRIIMPCGDRLNTATRLFHLGGAWVQVQMLPWPGACVLCAVCSAALTLFVCLYSLWQNSTLVQGHQRPRRRCRNHYTCRRRKSSQSLAPLTRQKTQVVDQASDLLPARCTRCPLRSTLLLTAMARRCCGELFVTLHNACTWWCLWWACTS